MNMFTNVAKVYCKKNPIKVAATVGIAVITGPILGMGLIATVAASAGGFCLAKKIEDKKDSK